MFDRITAISRIKEKSVKEGFVSSTLGRETFVYRKGTLIEYERQVDSLHTDPYALNDLQKNSNPKSE